MQNSIIEKIIYDSGLIAQGCWDELDRYAQDSIIRAIEMAAQECAAICMSQADKRNIRYCFGLPVESSIKYPSPEVKNSIESQYNREINIPKGDIK